VPINNRFSFIWKHKTRATSHTPAEAFPITPVYRKLEEGTILAPITWFFLSSTEPVSSRDKRQNRKTDTGKGDNRNREWPQNAVVPQLAPAHGCRKSTCVQQEEEASNAMRAVHRRREDARYSSLNNRLNNGRA
jgi:hypothetical protein